MSAHRWVAGIVAFMAVSLSVDSVAAQPEGQDRANVHATLIRVDVFHPAKGKPQPATANCSNDDGTSSNTDWALTGWKTKGGVAYLNTATVPAGLTDAAGALR